jgi:hypothetical protein
MIMSNILILDVQTLANPEAKDIWFDGPPPGEVADPVGLLTNPVSVIAEYLDRFGPHLVDKTIQLDDEPLPRGYLDYLGKLEGASKKPRKTVIDAIVKAQSSLDRIGRDAALTPETAKVCVLSYCSPAFRDGQIISGIDLPKHAKHHPEADMITSAARLIGQFGPIVVWNSEFTLYTLLERAAMLGIRMPRVLDMRSWGNDVIDLRRARYPHHGMKPKSLFYQAKALGIPNPVEGIVSGDDIAGLYETDPDAIMAYSQARMLLTREVYFRWARSQIYVPNLGVPDPDEALLDWEAQSIIDVLPANLRQSALAGMQKATEEIFE